MRTIRFVAPIITFVATIIVAAGLSACSGNNAPKYKIGVTQCSGGEWRDKVNDEMRREMLFHDDAILEIRTANDNNETQSADIDYFINNGFDLIIVAPNEAEGMTPAVERAYKKGIPVIIFDRRILGDSFTTYIDLDNKGIGLSVSEYVHSLLGDGKVNVLEITGLPGSTPAQERHAGFVEGLAAYPNINLLESVAGDWEFDRAYQVLDSMLDLYPDIDLIYAHNDFMALGVDSLLRERGRRDIKVLGTDASPGQGLEAIRDGRIDASFIYPTEGHRIIDTAFKILQGDSVAKVVTVPTLSSVDKSNAEILLRQNELLKDETSKVLLLDEINATLQNRHNTLSHFLNAVVALAIVLLVVLILVLFLFFKNRKLQKELKEQNQRLIEERDKQIGLYRQLDAVLTKEDEFYNKFMAIIKSDYADATINTDSLAQHFNIGGAQLTRKIKALTNFTPVEILRNYRLEQARHLLLTTDKNINEITFEVGFSSAPYLTKCFREHFGLTPTDLRSQK
ncbi:MAG: substrate-binding domain-containing protein [Muribaculaceae bacterium]|nr:substrate-binding domain-containing protein [Muribaculaceae bacterium]